MRSIIFGGHPDLEPGRELVTQFLRELRDALPETSRQLGRVPDDVVQLGPAPSCETTSLNSPRIAAIWSARSLLPFTRKSSAPVRRTFPVQTSSRLIPSTSPSRGRPLPLPQPPQMSESRSMS